MPQSDFEVLVTAAEAWPVFERAVMGAQSSLLASFRIFDMTTKLRSEEARALGDSWFDLLAHALSRGVRIHLVISDFDPIFATELHRLAWRTMRQAAALREIADCTDDQLRVSASLHPAKAGGLPWITFLPAALKRKYAKLGALKDIELQREAVRLDKDRRPSLHTTSHHQKLAVVDREWLYIGGLDLNERRYDDPQHKLPAERTWSDVQLAMRGPEAKEAAVHIEEFVDVVHKRAEPSKFLHIRRTLSAPRRLQFPFLSPKTVLSEIEEEHRRAFGAAQRLLHIETQYFRSRSLAEALAEQARKKPDLNAIIILPGLPDEVAFRDEMGSDARYGMALQRDALTTLSEAFGDRLILATPVRPVMAAREDKGTLSGSPLIHVHNKVLIEDETFALAGSANLNGRSLFWDTEAAVRITDEARVNILRKRLLSHWWFEPLPDEAMRFDTLFAWWQSRIAENQVLHPEKRHGFLVPHDIENLNDQVLALPGVTDNVV